MVRRPDIAKSAVIKYLQPQYGKVNLEPLYEGVESIAYRFESHHGPRVVRVSGDAVGFTKDQQAHQRFVSPRFPIARVYSIDLYDDYAVCVSEALPGVALDEAVSAVAETYEVPDVWQLLRNVQAQDIHTTHGYGEWGASGDAAYDSWRNYLLSALDGVDELAQHREIDTSAIDEIVSAYRELVEYCPEERVLVHGDYLGGNVLVDNGKISGLIDWKYSMYGDSLYDIGGSSFIGSSSSSVLIDTVRSSKPHDDFDERLTCYRLHVGLKNIRVGIHTGRMQWAQIALQASLNHIRAFRDNSNN